MGWIVTDFISSILKRNKGWKYVPYRKVPGWIKRNRAMAFPLNMPMNETIYWKGKNYIFKQVNPSGDYYSKRRIRYQGKRPE